MDVIAIFDIGKTNKKILLFDKSLRLIFQEEKKFKEILDDDGFECDDLNAIELWIKQTIVDIADKNTYNIKAINFTTYGATLVYLDEKGKRLTPAYNYLKPMPEGVIDDFYNKYGGQEEFCRITASPALGMLNSGLQILWLKTKKPEIFKKVKYILHFPQYLSYLITGKITSECTSIGCHTAMWNFDKMIYHKWLSDNDINLPTPIENNITFKTVLTKQFIQSGIGIHDSSSSLVPYFKNKADQFVLISTGTWCIFMNPFNSEPLTFEQTKQDTLCYLSAFQKQVKSSRLFMGHIHDVNVQRFSEHFKVAPDYYKKVKANEELLRTMLRADSNINIFLKTGISENFIDENIDLKQFDSFEKAYHKFMVDITCLAFNSYKLVIPEKDQTNFVYISGGFARNEIFTRLIASALPKKKVYTSEIDNSTALGAALVIYKKAFDIEIPDINLKLELQKPF